MCFYKCVDNQDNSYMCVRQCLTVRGLLARSYEYSNLCFKTSILLHGKICYSIVLSCVEILVECCGLEGSIDALKYLIAFKYTPHRTGVRLRAYDLRRITKRAPCVMPGLSSSNTSRPRPCHMINWWCLWCVYLL